MFMKVKKGVWIRKKQTHLSITSALIGLSECMERSVFLLSLNVKNNKHTQISLASAAEGKR